VLRLSALTLATGIALAACDSRARGADERETQPPASAQAQSHVQAQGQAQAQAATQAQNQTPTPAQAGTPAHVRAQAQPEAESPPLKQSPVANDAGPSRAALAQAIAGSAYAIIDVASHATLDERHGDWLDAPVWPGSIAKLATYTAAIDAGTLSDDTHILCTRRVTLRDGRHIDCSHPATASALSLREAVAMSCNVFAAEVARSLTPTQLAAGFTRLGLPSPSPSSGSDLVAIALGLDGAQMPPRGLLNALSRVMAMERVTDAHAAARALLRDGLRDSARNGTASAFGRAGIDAFAKTGTALMRNGHPLGLVVAIAPATAPRFGIVVALPGGAGADAADVAASLLQPRLAAPGRSPQAPLTSQVQAAVVQPAARAQTEAAPQARAPASTSAQATTASIRVGTPNPNGYRVDTLSLEDYVARVVAGETSSATPTAAREALAITARTYALANHGRHAADGFDLCTLTHCQVLRPASAASREAADRTRGRILTRDEDARAVRASAAVPVFYSAACGGLLDDASALLPNARPGSIAWMTSRPDPAGVAEPEWHADLSAADLMAALQASGVRGETLRDFSVRTNATGRATTIGLAGLTPSTIEADDFRRLIGQRLGWQWLKSLRFTVQRTARGYRFDGRGHGHGVGLCLFGAASLATRGRTADDILRIYFPGLRTVVRDDAANPSDAALPKRPAANATVPETQASQTTLAQPTKRAASAQPLEVSVRLPAAEESERAYVRSRVTRDLRELSAALEGAAPPRRISLIVHPTGDSYRRATGRPWWTSAATTVDEHGDATIHLVPLAGLRRTGRLDATLRHEMVHALTATPLRGRPLWVQEGIAVYFAGEHGQPAARDANDARDRGGDGRDRSERTDGSDRGDRGQRREGSARTDASEAMACPVDWDFGRAETAEAFQRVYARAAACVAREIARGVAWRSIGASSSVTGSAGAAASTGSAPSRDARARR
jgi:stage II sporulation protein D